MRTADEPPEGAVAFADSWIAAWNRRDIEAVLSHYAEEVVFTSPTAARIVPDTGGVVRGKAALRDYWTRALAGNPDLRFTLIGVYWGVGTLVIQYRNQHDALLCEAMMFQEGIVIRGAATQELPRLP